MMKNMILHLHVRRRWLLPLAACLCIVGILGGCSTEKAMSVETESPMITGETKQALKQLSESSEKLYQSMKANDPMLARSYLEGITRQFSALPIERMVHVEGMELIYETLGEARRTFNAVQFDPQLGLREAAKIHMLCDALSQPKHPLWKTYYKPMEDNVHHLQQAAQEQQASRLLAAYEELAGRYVMIKPSLAVVHPEHVLVKADSMFAFLRSHVKQATPSYTEVLAVHTELLHLLRELFGREEASDAPVYAPTMPIHPVLYWGVAIGSFIFTILAFVGFRRYRYERERPLTVPQKTDRDG